MGDVETFRVFGSDKVDKRCNLLGVIVYYVCPKCGTAGKTDIGDGYGYPALNRAENFNVCCYHCDHRWTLGTLTIRMQVELRRAESRE